MNKVLMFHRILPQKLISNPNAYSTFGTLISQEYFEKVILLLIDNDFHFTTISELGNCSKKTIALTFDDGYSDNFDFVLPILKKYNLTATFFPVVNPCINNLVLPLDIYYQCVDEMQIADEQRNDYILGETKKQFYWAEPDKQTEFLKTNFKLPAKSRVSYITEKQIKTLSDSDFEIGSHGLTHSLFTADYMNESKIDFELKQSKMILEKITGKAVASFCFPSGYYTLKSIEHAKNAGYTSVCVIDKKEKAGNYALPTYERIFVKPNSISELLEKYNQNENNCSNSNL
jgi:peptidoglycan/xylan/chitin deacetylase (PgdA/CDA1 family)